MTDKWLILQRRPKLYTLLESDPSSTPDLDLESRSFKLRFLWDSGDIMCKSCPVSWQLHPTKSNLQTYKKVLIRSWFNCRFQPTYAIFCHKIGPKACFDTKFQILNISFEDVFPFIYFLAHFFAFLCGNYLQFYSNPPKYAEFFLILYIA